MDTQYMAYWLDGDSTEHLMDPDLPLSELKVTRERNGLGRLTASLPPEYGKQTAFNARPVIQEWATAIYVEIAGDLFDGFLVVEVEDDNEQLTIDAVGWTGYGDDQPWSDRRNDFNEGNVSVATIIRRIWDEVQRLHGANIGLDVSLDGAWPRIGNPIEEELPVPVWPGPAPRPKAGKQPKAPSAPSGSGWGKSNYEQLRKQHDADMKAWRKKDEADRKAKQAHDEKVREYEQEKKERARMFEDAKFKMNYWSTTNLLSVFTSLSKEVGFSYRVDHKRSGNSFTHTLVCRSGRLGTRRHDVRFIEGENVYSVPSVSHVGSDKVTSAVILGQGDGSSTRWRQTSRSAGGSHGLRRAKVFVDKTLTRDAQLKARALDVLEAYADPIEIDEFVVIDHGLAPVRVFDVGDEILLQTYSRRAGNFDTWVTIQSITLEPEKGTMTVKVVPGVEANLWGST